VVSEMVSAKRGTRLGWPSGRRARDVVRFGSGRRPWASEQRSVSCPPAFLTARTVRGGLFGCSSCRRALPMDHPVCGLGSKSARIAPDRAAACRPRRAGRSCRKEQLAPHDGCHHRQRNRPTEHGPSVRVRKLVRAHGSRPRRKRDHAHVEAREWLEVRQVGRSLPRFCSDVQSAHNSRDTRRRDLSLAGGQGEPDPRRRLRQHRRGRYRRLAPQGCIDTGAGTRPCSASIGHCDRKRSRDLPTRLQPFHHGEARRYVLAGLRVLYGSFAPLRRARLI
jgi:hypothetical protein